MRHSCICSNFALSLVLLMLVAFIWSPPVAALADAADFAALRTPPGRPTPRAPAPTRSAGAVPTARPAVPEFTVGTPVPAYQGAEVIRTFAATYLGANVGVGRTYATSGSVKLPPTVQAEVDMAVELAGQAAAGAITAGTAKGAAQVAVGQGTISGTLDADLTAASLGAYSLVVSGAPADGAAALALLRVHFPAMTSVNLQPNSGSGMPGYHFMATLFHPAIDPVSHEATTVVEQIMAGVEPQGQSTLVWIVVANGSLAGAVTP